MPERSEVGHHCPDANRPITMSRAVAPRVIVQPCQVWGLIPQPMRLLPNHGLRGAGGVIVDGYFLYSVA